LRAPQLVPLDRLYPDPENPRDITPEELRNLAASIRDDPDFLVKRPVLAYADGRIYAGNQRREAFSALLAEGWLPPWGTPLIPADLDDVSEAIARQRAIRDNNQWGRWNELSLASYLAHLDGQANLSLLGFADEQVSALLALAAHQAETLQATELVADTGPGHTVADALAIYQSTQIRQIVLYFPPDQYEDMLARLDRIRARLDVETNTEAVAAALEAFDTEAPSDADSDASGEPLAAPTELHPVA